MMWWLVAALCNRQLIDTREKKTHAHTHINQSRLNGKMNGNTNMIIRVFIIDVIVNSIFVIIMGGKLCTLTVLSVILAA